jgi:hypothetical protein
MAVQPARWASTGMRPLGAAPRPRQTRARPAPRTAGASRSVATAMALRPVAGAKPRASAAVAVRPATRTVPVAAPPMPRLSAEWGGRLRIRPSATLLALIIAGTMLGLVYVTQMLAAASARYEVDTLTVQRQALMQTLTSQEASIAQWGSEAQVVQWAQGEGYDRLGNPIRVKAH